MANLYCEVARGNDCGGIMIDNLLTAALISILASAIFALGYCLGARMPKRCEVCGEEIES